MVGRTAMWKGWSDTQVWQIIGRDILAVEVRPGEWGAPPPYQVPQPRVPMPGRDVSIPSGYKNLQGLWLSETQSFCGPRQFLLEGPCMDLLGSFLCSSSSEAAAWEVPGTYRWNWSVWHQGKSWGRAAFCQTKLLAEAIVPFLRPHHHRFSRQVPYLSLHQPGSHCLPPC